MDFKKLTKVVDSYKIKDDASDGRAVLMRWFDDDSDVDRLIPLLDKVYEQKYTGFNKAEIEAYNNFSDDLLSLADISSESHDPIYTAYDYIEGGTDPLGSFNEVIKEYYLEKYFNL